MKVGQRFEVFPPAADWNLHHNTITGCLRPVVLDAYGSPTSIVRANTVTRGEAAGVRAAVEIAGRFCLIGNQVNGFDEKDSAGLLLTHDRFGKPLANVCRGNIVQGCSVGVREAAAGLWDACLKEGNEFRQCGQTVVTTKQ